VQSARHPLRCCISVALPHPPLPPLLVHLHLVCFVFCILLFCSFFSVFLRVHSTVCNYLIFVVWGGLWNIFSFVLLLGSFSCAISDTPSLTAFIGGQFFWSLHQESIGPRHSFDVLPLLFSVYLSCFGGLGSLCLGCLALSL
jgi:hypothetical protein